MQVQPQATASLGDDPAHKWRPVAVGRLFGVCLEAVSGASKSKYLSSSRAPFSTSPTSHEHQRGIPRSTPGDGSRAGEQSNAKVQAGMMLDLEFSF